MAEPILTRELSICLIPNKEIINDVSILRKELDASPYRDDIPHITLLRGITANDDLSDEALVHMIDRTTGIKSKLPLIVNVRAIANASNRFYSLSSGMVLDAPHELLDLRKQIALQLETHGFSVEPQELTNYVPHITIRLGVPLEDERLSKAEALFIGRTVIFSQWLLFRVVKQNDKRFMHEVWPDQISV
jgi:2'-5' RNA ligase